SHRAPAAVSPEEPPCPELRPAHWHKIRASHPWAGLSFAAIARLQFSLIPPNSLPFRAPTILPPAPYRFEVSFRADQSPSSEKFLLSPAPQAWDAASEQAWSPARASARHAGNTTSRRKRRRSQNPLARSAHRR